MTNFKLYSEANIESIFKTRISSEKFIKEVNRELTETSNHFFMFKFSPLQQFGYVRYEGELVPCILPPGVNPQNIDQRIRFTHPSQGKSYELPIVSVSLLLLFLALTKAFSLNFLMLNNVQQNNTLELISLFMDCLCDSPNITDASVISECIS